MPAPRRAPSTEQLRDYRARRLTQQEMVAEYFAETGVKLSRSAFAMAMHRDGLTDAAPSRHSDLLPWAVRPEHRYHRDARYLRLESRRRAGQTLRADDARRLQAWLDDLDTYNAVVYYHPNTKGGFWWVVRKPTDTDIIRAEHPGDVVWEVGP